MKLTTIALAILLIIGCMAGYVYMTEPITTYGADTNGVLLDDGGYLLTDETCITNGSAYQPSSPSVYRDNIIYTDWVGGSSYAVMMYNVSNGSTQTIIANNTPISRCAQSGHIIAYRQENTLYYYSLFNSTITQVNNGAVIFFDVHDDLIAYVEMYGADFSIKVYDTSGLSNPPLILNITEHDAEINFRNAVINTNGTTICYGVVNTTSTAYTAREQGIYNDFNRSLGSNHWLLMSYEDEELFYTYVSGATQFVEVENVRTSGIIWSESEMGWSMGGSKSGDWALYFGEEESIGYVLLTNVRTGETMEVRSDTTLGSNSIFGYKLYQFINGTYLMTYDDATTDEVYMRYLISMPSEDADTIERTTSRAEQLEEGFEETTGIDSMWLWVAIVMTIIISAYAYYRYRKPKYREV